MTSVYRRLKAAVPVVVLVAAVGAGIAYRANLVSWWAGITTPAAANASPATAPELAGKKDALALPADVAKRLEVQTEPARPSTVPSTLELSGSLILDSDRLAHVHARFPGEVVELGNAGNGSRPVAFGQHVRKGQLLAVIWSQDLGEKKSELIDALSQLRVDEDSLQRISEAAAEGAVPDRILRDTRAEGRGRPDRRFRAVRTLQSWRLSKEEIDEVRAEADPARSAKRCPTARRWSQQWAKLDVVAPLDGVDHRAQRGPRRAGRHHERPVQGRRPFAAGSAGLRLRGRPAHVGRPARQPAGVVGDRGLRRRRRHADRPFRPGGLHHRSQPAHGPGDGLGRQPRRQTSRGAVRHHAVGDSAAAGRSRGSRVGLVRRERPHLRLRAVGGQSDVRPPQRCRHPPPRRQGVHPQPAHARGNASWAGAAGSRASRWSCRGSSSWPPASTVCSRTPAHPEKIRGTDDQSSDSLGRAQPAGGDPAGRGAVGLRHLCLSRGERRGLSRSGAGHRRGGGPLSRRVGRGGRAAGDDPAGGGPGRHARADHHPHAVVVRVVPHQQPVRIRRRSGTQARQEVLNRLQIGANCRPG